MHDISPFQAEIWSIQGLDQPTSIESILVQLCTDPNTLRGSVTKVGSTTAIDLSTVTNELGPVLLINEAALGLPKSKISVGVHRDLTAQHQRAEWVWIEEKSDNPQWQSELDLAQEFAISPWIENIWPIDDNQRAVRMLPTTLLNAKLAVNHSRHETLKWMHQMALAVQCHSIAVSSRETMRMLSATDKSGLLPAVSPQPRPEDTDEPTNLVVTKPLSLESFACDDAGIYLRLRGQTLESTEDLKNFEAFAAPEHLRFGKKQGRSDVFSLGVLFFRMLSGRDLVADRSASAIARDIESLEWPNPTTAKQLQELLANCLQPGSRRRAQARRIARRLARLRFEQPAELPAIRKHSRILFNSAAALSFLGTCAAIALLVVLPMIATQQIQDNRQKLQSPDPQTRHNALEFFVNRLDLSRPNDRAELKDIVAQKLNESHPATKTLIANSIFALGTDQIPWLLNKINTGANRSLIELALQKFEADLVTPVLTDFEKLPVGQQSPKSVYFTRLLASDRFAAWCQSAEQRTRRIDLLLNWSISPDTQAKQSAIAALTREAKVSPEVRKKVSGKLHDARYVTVAVKILIPLGEIALPEFTRGVTSRSASIRRAIIEGLLALAKRLPEQRGSLIEILVNALAEQDPALRSQITQFIRANFDEATDSLIKAVDKPKIRNFTREILMQNGSIPLTERLFKDIEPGSHLILVVQHFIATLPAISKHVADKIDQYPIAKLKLIFTQQAANTSRCLLSIVENDSASTEQLNVVLELLSGMGNAAVTARGQLLKLAKSDRKVDQKLLWTVLAQSNVNPALVRELLANTILTGDPDRLIGVRAYLSLLNDSNALAMLTQEVRRRAVQRPGFSVTEFQKLIVTALGPQAIDFFVSELSHAEETRKSEAKKALKSLIKTDKQFEQLLSRIESHQSIGLVQFLTDNLPENLIGQVSQRLVISNPIQFGQAQRLLVGLAQRFGTKVIVKSLLVDCVNLERQNQQGVMDTLIRFGAEGIDAICDEFSNTNPQVTQIASRSVALYARKSGFAAVRAKVEAAANKPKSRTAAVATLLLTRPESIPTICKLIDAGDPGLQANLVISITSLGSTVFEPVFQYCLKNSVSGKSVLLSVLRNIAIRDRNLKTKLIQRLAAASSYPLASQVLSGMSGRELPQVFQQLRAKSVKERYGAHKYLFSLKQWNPSANPILVQAIGDADLNLQLLAITTAKRSLASLTKNESSALLTQFISFVEKTTNSKMQEKALNATKQLIQAKPDLKSKLSAHAKKQTHAKKQLWSEVLADSTKS